MGDNYIIHTTPNIYGQINANSGIGQLIIANPNGVLFDGATFTTAGDLMLTTKDLSNLKVEDLSKLDIEKEKFNQIYDNNGQLVGITIKNSDFQIGGEYNIVAPLIHAVNSDLTAKSLRFVTSNGQDYLALGTPAKDAMYPGVELEAVTIDGDVYIKTPTGSVRTTNGGTINGKLIKNEWYITRCACCGVKLKAMVKSGQIVPQLRYCSNCGSEEFIVEKLDQINFIDINFAALLKRIVEAEANICTTTRCWQEKTPVQPKLLVQYL